MSMFFKKMFEQRNFKENVTNIRKGRPQSEDEDKFLDDFNPDIMPTKKKENPCQRPLRQKHIIYCVLASKAVHFDYK